MKKNELDRLNVKIQQKSSFIDELRNEISKVIVGQNDLIDKILISVISNGHILLEGVPGLAKTLTINTVASLINAEFKRIQFTPDMLPADLLGTLIYNQKTGEFNTKKGPIFSNIILADEINRAPSKVQSALLESMQERQVTIGDETFKLSTPFLVLATQNPIEQEGTYPLPEAQVDRFMMKVLLVIIAILILVFLLTQLFALKSQWNIETHPYTVLKKEMEFEIRSYESALYTTVKLPGNKYRISKTNNEK